MVTATFTLMAVGLATIWDIRTRRIPNVITIPAVLLGWGISVYSFGLIGLKNTILGTAAGFALLLIPFLFSVIGGGDVKLLAAVGALNGLPFVLNTFLYAAVAGGALALGFAILKRQIKGVLFNVLWILRDFSVQISDGKKDDTLPLPTSGIKFPYGIAIFAGTVAAYWLR